MTLDLRTRPVTEEEARNKSCPLTFAQDGGPFGCIGSSCMFWRWHKDGFAAPSETATGHCGGGGPL